MKIITKMNISKGDLSVAFKVAFFTSLRGDSSQDSKKI
jgi:hypothetical protein